MTAPQERPITRVEFDGDDPMLAVVVFRHLRDLLGGPDIGESHVGMYVDFTHLTTEQRKLLDDLARHMWALSVTEVPE